MSEYDIICNFRTDDFSLLVPSKMSFFRNFFVSQPIKLKFSTGIQNWMLILIFGSKSCFEDDFGQYDTKPIILWPFLVFLAKRFLEIALSWQHVRFQVIKNYLKESIIC